MSSSGNEVYITIQSPMEEISVIARISKQKEKWSDPEIVAFSGNYNDLEPFLSPDNLRLYFVSNRPLNKQDSLPKDFDIWFVERTTLNSVWSEPKNLETPINTEHNEFYPSVSKNNNLYFTSDSPGAKGKDDIFYSEWNNNQYSTPVSLNDSINTAGYEFNAFIAPDESFILFTGYNRSDGFGSGDLYISFKNENKEWTQAKNLGANINSRSMDYCPFVDFKSQTLYFTSRRSAIKNANTITSAKRLDEIINQFENGESRIYKVSVELIMFLFLKIINNT